MPAVVVAAAVLAAATVFGEASDLEVRLTPEGDRRVLRLDVRRGDTIALHYQHSVERTPVVEIFRVEPDGLWFVEMRFASQGAGLPTEGYVWEGNQFVHRRPRRIGALPVRVSALAGHRLRVGRREVDLVAEFRDGSAVTIAAAPRPRWLRLPGAR
ncbi:MAG: DUF1850 domain-containing protein [Armatimonadota bacterium]|nr:DUF1850 domain-containing protein [Armatimonadota bacterium]MDR7550984.1 DUF1850 domain-containing protein [Armatimonadota bacterium]